MTTAWFPLDGHFFKRMVGTFHPNIPGKSCHIRMPVINMHLQKFHTLEQPRTMLTSVGKNVRVDFGVLLQDCIFFEFFATQFATKRPVFGMGPGMPLQIIVKLESLVA